VERPVCLFRRRHHPSKRFAGHDVIHRCSTTCSIRVPCAAIVTRSVVDQRACGERVADLRRRLMALSPARGRGHRHHGCRAPSRPAVQEESEEDSHQQCGRDERADGPPIIEPECLLELLHGPSRRLGRPRHAAIQLPTMFSTCWATRRFNRPARTSTQRSEGCTNQCELWSNPARLASLLQANLPAAAGLFASRLPPDTGSPSFTDCYSWRGRRDSNPRPPA
jgi:hypothetical protein